MKNVVDSVWRGKRVARPYMYVLLMCKLKSSAQIRMRHAHAPLS